MQTFYREELRKAKQSQGTCSGAKDLYVSKWKFFEECSFLEEVISSNQQTFTNISNPDSASTGDELESEIEVMETKSERSVGVSSNGSTSHPKKRKRSTESPMLESAASPLNEIAKSSSTEDHWDVFGKDVANFLRSLPNKDLQRQVKFAIQSSIFQTTEPPRPTYATYNFPDESCHGLYPTQLISATSL